MKPHLKQAGSSTKSKRLFSFKEKPVVIVLQLHCLVISDSVHLSHLDISWLGIPFKLLRPWQPTLLQMANFGWGMQNRQCTMTARSHTTLHRKSDRGRKTLPSEVALLFDSDITFGHLISMCNKNKPVNSSSSDPTGIEHCSLTQHQLTAGAVFVILSYSVHITKLTM
jgi:hypothetical protein